MIVPIALLVLAAYILGTIPFGLIVAAARGVNIRAQGSGNYGATNVGRVMGARWGVLVFALDVGKGATATLAARWAVQRFHLPYTAAAETAQDGVLLAAGLMCVIGNAAPFYLGFRGGKAVATSLGVLFGIWPYLTLPGLMAFALWGIVVLASGYVSLASIVAASSLPVLFIVMASIRGWGVIRHWPLLALTLGLAVLIVIRHRANLARLRSGTETRIGKRRK